MSIFLVSVLDYKAVHYSALFSVGSLAFSCTAC